MMKEGIVLGYLVSERKIEMDKAKIRVMEKLALPTFDREVWSFLGHVDFYPRFIKGISKISSP